MAWQVSWTQLLTDCYKGRSRQEQKKNINRTPSFTKRMGVPVDFSPGSPLPDISNSAIASNLHVFTLAELRTITQNFSQSNFLGEGGFGPVHKGYIDEKLIPGLKAMRVAVKLLDLDGLQGHREWLTEVIFLGQLTHPNLVKLIGYCCEDENRLLVYEYMVRGSLENQLFRNRFSASLLTWATRVKIALGAAEGLAFLHEAEKSVIYRDFKASNILLDSDYTAKLSDFGLAKDGPEGDNTHVSTRVMGTQGYAAPEYVMTGHLTAMSDVYSFGVVLLEILTGRRSMDKARPVREQNLTEWARPYLNDPRKIDRLMDPRLDGQYSIKGAHKAAQLAHQCLKDNPKSRPTMREVVKVLEQVQSFNDIPVGTFVYTVSPSPVKDKPKTEPTKKDGTKTPKLDEEDDDDHHHEKKKNESEMDGSKEDEDSEKDKSHHHKRRRSPGHRHKSAISPAQSETSLYKYFNNGLNSPRHVPGTPKEELFK